jgi:4-amino-4-deoxy-L-arabinose transferase-like glycosyltransferase
VIRRRWGLVVVAAALLGGRLALAYHLRTEFFTSGDQSYNDIAEQLLHGHGFTMNGKPYIDNPPVYPLLVAGVFGIFGHGWWAIAVLQSLVDSVSALLVLALGRRLFGSTVGSVAAAAYAVYPYLASQAVEIMDTSVFVCALLAFLYLCVRTSESRAWPWAAGAGAAAGIAYLIRPTVAVVALLFPLLVAVLGARARTVVRVTAVAAAAALIVVAPWTVRNAIDFHAFVPGAAKAGINFWKGNSPHAAAYIAAGRSVDLLTERADAPHQPAGLNPVQADAWWRHRALMWIRAHPGAWAHALWVKLVAFWSWQLNPRTYGETGAKDVIYTATYGPLLVLALLGSAAAWRWRRRAVLFLWSVILAFTAVHVLTVGYTRLRAPLDPLLMLPAAALVLDVGKRLASTRARP